MHSFVLTSYCLVRSKQLWQFKSAASKTEFKEPLFFFFLMEHKTVTLHIDTTSWRNSWQVCSDILFENFFFISDFFHSELHNYIYLMFSFSFGVWTVEKENNIISEKNKTKMQKHFWTLKRIKTAMKINSSNDFKRVGTWREEAGNSAELTGHHLFFEKESNFLRSCHTVNFEMDLNQLVADITMKEWCVCEWYRVHDCVLFWFWWVWAMIYQVQNDFSDNRRRERLLKLNFQQRY